MKLLVNKFMLNYRSDIKNGQYVFDIPSLANSMGVTAVDLLAQLQYLKVILKCNHCYLLYQVDSSFLGKYDLFYFSYRKFSSIYAVRK